jgi:hypothetical protein
MRRSKSRSAIRSVSSSPFSANGRFWPSGPALALLHVKHSCAYSIGRNRPLSRQRLLPPVLHRHRHLSKSRKLKRRTATCYLKTVLTFSDAITAVRHEIWEHQISFMSRPRRDRIEIPHHMWWEMRSPGRQSRVEMLSKRTALPTKKSN